jgi:hypothetical protein
LQLRKLDEVALKFEAAIPTSAFILGWLVANVAGQNGTPSDSDFLDLMVLK